MAMTYTFMVMLCIISTVSVEGAVVAAIGSLATAIASVAPTHRQINIVLRNHCTSHKLNNPWQYMVSGSAHSVLPHSIAPNLETMLEFRKTAHTARGAVGVFTFDLVNTRTHRSYKELAILFSVPYNYMFHSNWYAAGFFPQWRACNYNLYYQMYYKRQRGFTRRKAPRHITYRDGRFTVKAAMTNTYTPLMTVDVYDNWTRG